MNKAERIRKRLFARVETFDPRGRAFVPLPIVLRVAQFLFKTPRHFQVYCYVLMRTGREGVAWFTLKELAWDIAYRSVSKLRPFVADLEESGWIQRQESRGKDYYIVPDACPS